MKMPKLSTLLFFTSLVLASCNSRPRIIESEPIQSNISEASIPSLENLPFIQAAAPSIHEVIVKEVLNTEKYNYLLVKEAESQFWIATSKMEVQVGEALNYEGGLLKKNFFS